MKKKRRKVTNLCSVKGSARIKWKPTLRLENCIASSLAAAPGGAPDDATGLDSFILEDSEDENGSESDDLFISRLFSKGDPSTGSENRVSLRFVHKLTDNLTVKWDAVLCKNRLYVEIVDLPEGSRDSFVSLLDFAEENLHCSHVVVCFLKDTNMRGTFTKTFMYQGFSPLAPHCSLISHKNTNYFFMGYELE